MFPITIDRGISLCVSNPFPSSRAETKTTRQRITGKTALMVCFSPNKPQEGSQEQPLVSGHDLFGKKQTMCWFAYNAKSAAL